MKYFNFRIGFLLIFIIGGCQAQYADLNKNLESIARENYLPGFAVALVDNEKVLYQNAFGFADIETKTPYTINTIQSVASVSKTTIGFSIMKLIEQGKLNLDTPINSVLPFTIVNPNFPEDEITIKHLATHTSSIQDTENNYDIRNKFFLKETRIDNENFKEDWLLFFNRLKQNKRMNLAVYCHSTLNVKGKWYDVNSFLNNIPGTQYQYSNLGANLAAYIVEILSEMPYEEYTQQYLFNALKMDDTVWDVQKTSKELLAKTYLTKEKLNTPVLGNSTFPDGGLFTNCNDLSKYLVEMLKGYSGKSSLLDNDLFVDMMSPKLIKGTTNQSNQKKVKNSGVFWMISNDDQIFHNGGDPLGSMVYMRFNPVTKKGRILMTNYMVDDKESHGQFKSIWKALGNYTKNK